MVHMQPAVYAEVRQSACNLFQRGVDQSILMKVGACQLGAHGELDRSRLEWAMFTPQLAAI